MGWKDKIRPIKDPSVSSSEATDIPISDIEEGSGDTLETLAGTAYGAGQGVTAGYLDEILAAAAAGGKKATEVAGIANETPKSLADLYSEYKKTIRQKGEEYTKKAGLPATVAEIGGAIVGPGKLLKGASSLGLLGRLGVAGGAGAIEGYGKSEGETPMTDIGAGALAGVAGGAIGEGLATGTRKVADLLMDTQLGRQLLAVTKHAGEGGSIYGEKAGIESTRKTLQETASDVTSKLTKGISESNEMIRSEAQKATQAGKMLDIEPIKEALNYIENSINTKPLKSGVPLFSSLQRAAAPETKLMQQYSQMGMGEVVQKPTLTPTETIKLIDQLKDYSFSLTTPEEKFAVNQLRESLEAQFNSMIGGKTTVDMLKAIGHRARSFPEPFIQQKGRITYPTPEQPVLATQTSSMPYREMEQTVRQNIESILRQGGKPSTIGQEARADISNLPQYIQDLNKITGGQIKGLGDDITKELSQKSALIGAKQSVYGQLGAAGDVEIEPGIASKMARKIFSSPFKIAEAAGKTKTGYNTARYLLEESDERLFGLANQLKTDPKFSHYGKAIEDAVVTGKRNQLNPVFFAMMQNPTTREMMRSFVPGGEENE
jgi:hypothetical protein